MFARKKPAQWSGKAERVDRGAECPICKSPSSVVGSKHGTFSGESFEVRRCSSCNFAYVRDAMWSDDLYNEAYYRGRGADGSVDYVFELENPDRTVRAYEWCGVTEIVGRALGTNKRRGARWLDYGCGTGGLVRHAEAQGYDAWGFEEGYGNKLARAANVPLLDRASLDNAELFDVVTAVEVLEHVFDVHAFLASVRKVLAPGGVFFYTTGNPAGRHGDALLSWNYLVPEIHVSFYEPTTMERALAQHGFRSEYLTPSSGHAEIVRYKVLKGLGIKTRLPAGLPWGLRTISPIVRSMTGVLAHPIGIAV